MNIDVHWENLIENKIIENEIKNRVFNSFYKYKLINNININVSKGNSNSRIYVKLDCTTNDGYGKLRAEGVSCDINFAMNDLLMNFKKVLGHYNQKDTLRRIKLEEKWKQDAIKNKEKKLEEKAKELAIIEENKRRAKINEEIRRKNELIKRDYKMQKNLVKKMRRQEIIDAQTRYELEKDFYERQRILEEKRLLQEARLKEVARIQKEIISKDLELEEKYKDKKTELRSLKERNNEVAKITNQIINIESKYYDEIWEANSPFQNEVTGEWYYHDGQGNFYRTDENNEWVVDTKNIIAQLDEIKKQRINKLLEEKDQAQLRQEKVSNTEYLNQDEEGLDIKSLEKLQKNIDENDAKLQNLIKEKENKIFNLTEKHPANESWLGDDNRYYYHDGNGNYFTTNENNEWIKTTNPEIVKIEQEYNKQKITYLNKGNKEEKKKETNKVTNKQEDKKNKKDNKLPKPNEAYEFEEKWYYFDENGNYYTTNENNEWVSTINPHVKGKSDNHTTALEDSYDHSEPFQDENGVWWYIDANNQYYYADNNGNWIKWTENN